jgi:hypothetical protein
VLLPTVEALLFLSEAMCLLARRSEHQPHLGGFWCLIGYFVRTGDAHSRPASRGALVGRVLRRDEVIGTTSAEDAFAVANAILAHDERVVGLLGD